MQIRRILKINSLLKREISDFITHLNLDAEFITLTDINLNSDLSRAAIYITSPLGKEEEIIKKLNKSKEKLRGFLLKRLNLKRIPRLDFIADSKADQADRVEELLDEVSK